MPAGRPTKYTKELAQEICSGLASGLSLREVCRANNMPDERTVRQWALDDLHGFSPQYARARELGYQSMADELMEIADDGTNDWIQRHGTEEEQEMFVLNGEHVQRSRLRVDTRKWMLSKMLPKVYGDKTQLQHSGPDGGPIAIVEERIVKAKADS